MAASRFFSNTAVQTALSGNISSGATSINVSAVTGFPALPYTLAIDFGFAPEELVNVTAAAGTTLTVTRGYGGTSAQSHSIGAVVRHVYDATEASAFRTHEGATAAIHGVTGTLVGTSDTQTLGNKTLTAPAVTNPAITGGGSLAGTFTGTPTFSGAVVLSGQPQLTGANINGGTLVGNFIGTPAFVSNVSFSGAPLFTGGPNFNSAAAGNASLSTAVTGDVFDRLRVQSDGTMLWGNGTLARDTNLYRQAAATLRTDNSLQVGGSLTVTGIGGVLRARKTADTSIVSSTTLTTDTMLTIPVVAGAIYELEGGLFYGSASQTPDFNVTVSGPAGASGFWCTTGPNTTATTDPPNDTATPGSGNRTIASGLGVPRVYGVSTPGSIYGLNITGMVEVAATVGNVTIDWAQATANATATTLKQYSWLRLTRVA